MSQIRLNTKQKEAVQYDGGDLLIIAGAGTGKTAVITQRIVHIIKKELAKPSEILALTFTEKASFEMKERVDIEMEYGYDEPWISTFHSFCDRILREEGYNIGLDGNYSLMSKAQEYIFLRKHVYELPLKTLLPKGNNAKFLNDLINHFSRLQDEDVSTEDYIKYAKSLPNKTKEEKLEYQKYKELSETYKKYSELKIEKSKIDFGDLIVLTLKLFRERPNILEKYRKQFKYILVDEFQDTNYTQNVLINTVKDGRRQKLTVVGDDDQAIYKFRGAAISNILQFKKIYPDAKEIVLTENYRSKQEILDSAYTLIKHNNPNRLEVTEKIEKKLIAKSVFKDNDKAVSLMVASNEVSEAEKISNEILKITGYESNGDILERTQVYDKSGQSALIDLGKDSMYDFNDVAILIRAHSHGDAIVQALRNAGIPYKLGGSRGLYFRPEIQNIISFLRILVDYSNEIAMYKLLSMNIWNLSVREYIEINKLARLEKTTLFEELEKLWSVKLGSDEIKDLKNVNSKIVERIFDAKAIAGISNLLLIIDESLKKIKDGRPIIEIVYDFIKNSGYIDSFLKEESSENIFAVSNIQKFFELIKQYEKDNSDTNIYEYVDYLNYCIEIGESPIVDQSEMEEFNGVNILTVHGAKGLEFPVVFLVDLVSQRFPAQNRGDAIPIPESLIKETYDTTMSNAEAHLGEERRLFYVGATRAKEKLYLTAAKYYGDAKTGKKPSIFLNEILDEKVIEDFEKIEKEKNIGVISIENYEPLVPKDMKVDLMRSFSYSQLRTYEECPRKYEYSYILKVPQKPSSVLSFGITIHNTLRDFYTILKRSKEGLEGMYKAPTLKDLLEIYDKSWISTGYESTKQEKGRKKEGKIVLEKYFENMYSEKQNPIRLEESFSVHFGDSMFNGKIDRIDRVKGNEVCIVDYKTGKEKSDANIKNDLQLPLYAVFTEAKFGFKVVEAKYVFIESLKEVSVDISDMRRNLAKEKLLGAIDSIRAKNFKPTPNSFLCSFCDYNSVCEFAEI
ncbi:MAG: ATP-dependent DNA helicase [Candidatus Dojkabacteria bacterium]|nr:ATP-dependent DNA helicase [Candidatus Dojkabacteria bacterium]